MKNQPGSLAYLVKGNKVLLNGVVDTVISYDDEHVYCKNGGYGKLFTEVTGIPLNEKEIKKLGFSFKNEHLPNVFFSKDEHFSIEKVDGEYHFYTRQTDELGTEFEDVVISKVGFVHELQNSFYFTTWKHISTLVEENKEVLV